MRTGRANTAMVEEVLVECYGAMQPIKQIASLSIPDNASIAIAPWDKTVMKAVETAILKASTGLSVVNTGDKIIARLPIMTEENRKDIIKILGKKIEEGKVAIRQLREKVKTAVIEAERNKEISEDDKFQELDLMEKYCDSLTEEIEKMRQEKEKEIMSI